MTSKHYRPGQKLLQWFLLCIVVSCIGGGVALLAQYQQGGTKAGASGAIRAMPQYGDMSVSGPPTLTAATVDAIFARMGSPMVGTGKVVESMSRQTSIDDAFAMGVWWTETNDGAAGVGSADRNPGSVRGSVGYPSAYDGYTIYPSYTAAIVYWFNMLRNNYVHRGLGTVYTIARPYVGTTSYPLWAGKVINLIWSYRGIAPPPPIVTSTPPPKPTITPAQQAITRARNHKFTTLQQSLSDGNAAPIYSQGLSQEPSPFPSTASSTSDATTMSGFVQNAVVLSGLLLAVVVLFVGFKFKGNSTVVVDEDDRHQDDRKGHPYIYTNTSSQAALDFAHSTSTEDLPVLPTSMPIPVPMSVPVSESPSQQRVTEALPRRVLLLPSYGDRRTRVEVEVGVVNNAGERQNGRPQGLLKRYG